MTINRPFKLFWANALMAIAAFFFLPADTSAVEKESQVDRERLFSKSDQLLDFMSAQQRLEYARAESLVENGHSDLRRGQFFIDRKPSAFNPNEDLGPIKKQGEALVASGRAKIESGENKIFDLLVQAERVELLNRKPDKESYESSIIASPSYETALEETAKALLDSCWEKGYNRIFYDRVYHVNDEGAKIAELEVRNKTYDILIRVDGTRFSVVMPVDLELDITGREGSFQFSFEDSESFASERIAVLSIQEFTFNKNFFGPFEIEKKIARKAPEKIVQEAVPEESEFVIPTEGEMAPDFEIEKSSQPIKLLVLQAIDINTLQLINQELRWITPENTLVPVTTIEDQLKLTELKQTIQSLASLPEPYIYRIQTGQTAPVRAAMLESYLLEILESYYELSLVPFMSLKPLVSEESPVSISDFGLLSNASLILESDADSPSKHKLTASADQSNRSLALGWIELLTE